METSGDLNCEARHAGMEERDEVHVKGKHGGALDLHPLARRGRGVFTNSGV